MKIIQSIECGYSKASGYGGRSNYDIFTSITYDVYKNVQDREVVNTAIQILEEHASIRYSEKDLLEELKSF